MQKTESKKSSSNKIYELAKKSLHLKQEKKEKVLDQIGNLIDDAFEKGTVEFIDDAINIAYKNAEIEVFNIISDEVQISVECMFFKYKEKIYDSNIMLLPIMFKTNKNAEVTLPSIQAMEKIIKKALVNKRIYPNADFINLAVYRFDQETAENITMKNWWDSHKNIVEHFNQNEVESESQKNHESKVVIENGLLLSYYVIHLHHDIDEQENIPNISLMEDKEFWKNIFKPLHKTAQMWIEALPPASIFDAITDGKIFLENERLKNFLYDFITPEVEILLSPVEETDEPSQYAIIVVNQEDRTLISFYVYDIYQDTKDLFELVNDYSLQKVAPLFKYNDNITVEELNEYTQSKGIVDLNKKFKNSEYINTTDTFIGIYGYNKYQVYLN